MHVQRGAEVGCTCSTLLNGGAGERAARLPAPLQVYAGFFVADTSRCQRIDSGLMKQHRCAILRTDQLVQE